MKNNTHTPTAELPTGFDDALSGYYIPEHLRAHYLSVQAARDTGDFLEAARRYLAEIYVHTVYGPVEIRDPRFAPGSTHPDEAARIAKNQERSEAKWMKHDALTFDEVAQCAAHLARLAASEKAHEVAAQQELMWADRERRYSCRVCGVMADGKHGEVRSRAFTPRRMVTEPFVSCDACFLVAQNLLTLELASTDAREHKVRAKLANDRP